MFTAASPRMSCRCSVALLGASLCGVSALSWAAPPTLRVLTHASFDVPKPLLDEFETPVSS